jgi:hypothetical protein
VSLLLVHEYERWKSNAESGVFPEIRPDAGDWIHLNREYVPASTLVAEGNGLPRVTFEARHPDSMRMTVLNPGFRQKSRVLQALQTSKQGPMTFTRGRHPYFSGMIRVDRG